MIYPFLCVCVDIASEFCAVFHSMYHIQFTYMFPAYTNRLLLSSYIVDKSIMNVLTPTEELWENFSGLLCIKHCDYWSTGWTHILFCQELPFVLYMDLVKDWDFPSPLILTNTCYDLAFWLLQICWKKRGILECNIGGKISK